MKTLFKIFNFCIMVVLVIAALCWGIWGFFHIEVMSIFLGPQSARISYCIFGVCGLYGVHLFVDYTKKEWGLK